MYQNIEKPTPAKCASVIKIINLVTGGIIVAFGAIGIVYMAIQHLLSFQFFLVFSPIFMIMFGLCLVGIELKNEALLQHLGFLRTLLGRGLFNFYLSSQVYYYFGCSGTNLILAWISSLTLLFIGVLYLVLHFCAGTGYGKSLKEQLS